MSYSFCGTSKNVDARSVEVVLSFFGVLISRTPSRQGLGLGFGTLGWIFLRIPSRKGLELGHDSGSEPVTLPATLIHLLKNRGYRSVFSTSASQLSGFLLHCSDQKLTSFSKESNEVRLFWSSVSIKLDGLRMLEVRYPIVNFLPLGVFI